MGKPAQILQTGRLYSKFTATFYTETGEKIINGRDDNTSAQQMSPYLNAGLASFTSKNDNNDDMPAFSITLISGSVFGSVENWGDIIKPNDYVKIDVEYENTLAPVSGEQFNKRITLISGLVSQITRNADYENDVVSYTVSCQGVAKVLANAQLQTFSELTSTLSQYALLPDDKDEGIAFQSKCSREIISEIMDKFIYSQKNYLRYTYLMDGGRTVTASTIFTPFIYDTSNPAKEEAGNPDEKMMSMPSKYMNYNGSLLSLINDVADKPFNELYWTHEEGLATLHYRITPFDKERWVNLPSITVDNTAVKNVDITNTDQDQYSIFRLVSGVGNITSTNALSFLYPLTNSSLIRRYGYKIMEVSNDYFNPDIAPETSGGSSGESTSGDVPGDQKKFLTMSVNNDFGCDESKVIAGAKNSARVQAWLGGSTSAIKKVMKIVKGNGMSPQLFFAYELQEGGTTYGWLNHTSYTGDPYRDADSVSKWAVSQANSSGAVALAWTDAGNPSYTTPKGKQQAGQKFADSLPKGSIGRMYLSGTAAATWGAFDPEALKRAVNGVQDYANPLAGCMSLLKKWK